MIGTVRNPHHVFLARGVEHIADAIEVNEVNEGRFEWVALTDVAELIADGRVVNSGTLIGLLKVLALRA